MPKSDETEILAILLAGLRALPMPSWADMEAAGHLLLADRAADPQRGVPWKARVN